MEINIDLKTEKASYSDVAHSVDDWNFIKSVVNRILALKENLDEEKRPAAVKSRGPYKKSQDPQLYDSGVKKKVNKQVIEYLRNNCLTKDNDMLVTSLKDRFGINTTIHTVKWWMSQNGISRRRMKKEAEDHGIKFDDEKELPKLPPEDNY